MASHLHLPLLPSCSPSQEQSASSCASLVAQLRAFAASSGMAGNLQVRSHCLRHTHDVLQICNVDKESVLEFAPCIEILMSGMRMLANLQTSAMSARSEGESCIYEFLKQYERYAGCFHQC
jgi:hypothetical protein